MAGMSKEMGVILLGLWVVIVPYLGVPESWRTVFIILAGIAIAVIGLLLRGETLARGVSEHKHQPFVEQAPQQPVPPTPSEEHTDTPEQI